MHQSDATSPNYLRPAWITAELIEETRTVFQPLYPKEDLTDDEIVDLLQNVGAVFEILYPDTSNRGHEKLRITKTTGDPAVDDDRR